MGFIARGDGFGLVSRQRVDGVAHVHLGKGLNGFQRNRDIAVFQGILNGTVDTRIRIKQRAIKIPEEICKFHPDVFFLLFQFAGAVRAAGGLEGNLALAEGANLGGGSGGLGFGLLLEVLGLVHGFMADMDYDQDSRHLYAIIRGLEDYGQPVVCVPRKGGIVVDQGTVDMLGDAAAAVQDDLDALYQALDDARVNEYRNQW